MRIVVNGGANRHSSARLWKWRSGAVIYLTLGVLIFAQTPSYTSLVSQAKSASDSGDLNKAFDLASQALNLDQSRWEAYLIAGSIRVRQGRCTEASVLLGKSVQRAPDSKKPGIYELGARCSVAASPSAHGTSKASAESTTIDVPKVAADLTLGVYQYQVTMLSVGDRPETKDKWSTAIQDGGNTWIAVDTLEGSYGAVISTVTFEKGTLIVKKESSKGPFGALDLDFAGNRAIGTNTIRGQEHPIAVELDGPLFAYSAGWAQVVACLPLAQGFKTRFRNFNVIAQREEHMQLTVLDVEKVTVPSGTFDAYRVEIISAEDGRNVRTLWIDKASRKVVKRTSGLLTWELMD